jgi:CRP/FNR family transcriptional regulator, dissimilatory nitrate respiration regulator
MIQSTKHVMEQLTPFQNKGTLDFSPKVSLQCKQMYVVFTTLGEIMRKTVTMPENNPLFEGIEPHCMDAVFDYLDARVQSYLKDEYIMQAGNPVKGVGIMLTGSANVIKEDFWGNRTIIDNISPGELVGETFVCTNVEKLPLNLIAMQDCDVLFVNYQKILTDCKGDCAFHGQLAANAIKILANKNIVLMNKVEHMVRRTTRDKLLSYLSSRALKASSNTFTIPYNRQELADYLAVDRSAMSNELCKLRDDGVVAFNKNHFVLLKDSKIL